MGTDTVTSPLVPGGAVDETYRMHPPRERRAKLYDFRRPDKFSKDQIRTFSIMHETFARAATTTVSSMLRAASHFHVASVDQLTYEEFIRSIPNPTTIGVVTMEPLKGAIVFEIDPGLSSAMLDRLFGGRGKPESANSELTDIEISVMEGALERLLGGLQAAWASIIEIRPRLAAIETRPAFAQVVPPNEMIILVSMEGEIGGGKGMINIAVPYLTIEPIIPRLNAKYVYSDRFIKPETPRASAASLPMALEVCYEGERQSLTALTMLKRGALVRIPRFGEGTALLQGGGAPFLRLTAKTPGRADSPGYSVADQSGADELRVLGGVRRPAGEKSPDGLTAGLQSISAEMTAAIKSIGGKIDELSRRHEELADQLVFQSPDREVSADTPKEGRKRPFGFLTISYCEVLAAFMAREHVQLTALVLSYLEPGLAACVLEKLPEEVRAGVTERICTMERTSPEVLRVVEKVLEKKMSVLSSEDYTAAGGIAAAVEILNVASRGLEKHVVESLEKSNPGLAEEIKRNMFVFEDIMILAKETLGAVLAEVSQQDLLLSLKSASPQVCDYVGECLPEPKASALKAAIAKSGPARLLDVDAAQQRIVAIIRVMEEEGKIIVARPSDLVQ